MSITLGGQPLQVAVKVIPPMAPAGFDAEAAAETAWLECLVGASELRLTEHTLLEILTALEHGREWFESHTADDPLYAWARRRRNELWSHERTALNALWWHSRQTWLGCRDLFHALHLLPDARTWLQTHPLELLFDDLPQQMSLTMQRVPDLPQDIWRWLMGERPAPGDWPTTHDELAYARVRSLETWHIADLTAQLERRKEGARG